MVLEGSHQHLPLAGSLPNRADATCCAGYRQRMVSGLRTFLRMHTVYIQYNVATREALVKAKWISPALI
jgi:hypothetical protein